MMLWETKGVIHHCGRTLERCRTHEAFRALGPSGPDPVSASVYPTLSPPSI